MKILFITVHIVVGMLILKACNSPKVIDPISSGVVTDVRYVHDLDPETILVANSNEFLLEVVRATVVEDSLGRQTIFVGEESDQNSRIFYIGIAGEDLIFQLVPGGQSLSSNPGRNFIQKVPLNSKIISLWETELEVLEVSHNRIRCRVMPESVRI